MRVESPRDVTGLIAAWSKGDKQALTRMLSLQYPKLRRIAGRRPGRGPAYTLESANIATGLSWLAASRGSVRKA
jgi:hypothetical protein